MSVYEMEDNMKYIEYKKELMSKLFKGENIKLRNKGKDYVRLIYFRNELENLVIKIGISIWIIENDYNGINTLLDEVRAQWLDEWIDKKVVGLNGYELISLYCNFNSEYTYNESNDIMTVGKINKLINEIGKRAKKEKLSSLKYYDKYSAHNLLRCRGWDI